MKTTTEIEKKLGEQPLDNWVSTRKGPDNSNLEYMKTGAVALAMNLAFGPCGWEVTLDRIDVVDKQRVNGAGTVLGPNDVAANVMFNAIAVAVVTVTVHAPGGPRRHQDVATGTAFGGKAKTIAIAIDAAVKAAASNAFKRACRFFGPSTGLLLQFDKKDRKNVQALIDAMSHLREVEGSAEVTTTEGGIGEDVPVEDAGVVVDDEGAHAEDAPAPQGPAAPAEEPVAESPQTEMFQAEEPSGPVAFSQTLAELVGLDVAKRICSLAEPTDAISGADANAIHKAMLSVFGTKARATGVWGVAGVTLGKGVLVSRDQALAVAQTIEEATLGEGGTDGFLAQFDPQADPEQPVEEKVAAKPVSLAQAATNDLERILHFAGADVRKWLGETISEDLELPTSILTSFHKSLIAQFSKDRAYGIWKAIDVTPGKGVKVTRSQVLWLAQFLDEAASGEGGLEGWLSQFDKKEEVAASTAATSPTEESPLPPDDQIEAAHAAETKAADAESSNGNGNGGETHGDVVQEVIGQRIEDLERVSAELSLKLGPSRKELIQKLATAPPNSFVTGPDASGLHMLATNRLRNGNVPLTRVFDMWKKAGFVWGKGQPTIDQAKKFVLELPSE
jgi:hypothetical protein